MRDIKIWICIDIYKVNSFYHFVWFNLDPVVLLAFFFLFLYCFWRNCELVRTGLLCASCYYVNSSVISVSNLSWGSLKISTSALFKYLSCLYMCGSLKVNLLWHCIITLDPDYECFSSVQFRPLLVDTSSPFQNWNIVLSGFFICISIRIFHTCSLVESQVLFFLLPDILLHRISHACVLSLNCLKILPWIWRSESSNRQLILQIFIKIAWCPSNYP